VNQTKSANELGGNSVVVLSTRVRDQLCEEQLELAQVLTCTVSKVQQAMQNLESARSGNIDRKPHALALRNARAEARHAVATLDKYRKEHRTPTILPLVSVGTVS
jgi:hypothetical protein